MIEGDMMHCDFKTVTTANPIRDGTNWFVYCDGDSVNFVDLWGLEKLNMPGVPVNVQQILQKKHDKENTKIEVVRNPEKKVSNDVIRVYIDNEVIASYNCQSEKNYKSGEQTGEQSWEDDVAKRNVTLPCSDDYTITMMEESPSYNKPFKIESDSVQINGQNINNDGFMIHSWNKKEKQINGAYSWGCQILNNEDFKDFRTTLENIGFENGDSIPLEIKKNK